MTAGVDRDTAASPPSAWLLAAVAAIAEHDTAISLSRGDWWQRLWNRLGFSARQQSLADPDLEALRRSLVLQGLDAARSTAAKVDQLEPVAAACEAPDVASTPKLLLSLTPALPVRPIHALPA